MTSKAYHRIAIDPPAERMDFVLSGFWDEGHAGRFEAEFHAGLANMVQGGARIGHFRVLIDVRELAIFTPDMVMRFERFSAESDRFARCVAIVVSGALQSMQLRRIVRPDRHELFDSRDKALAWLNQIRAGESL